MSKFTSREEVIVFEDYKLNFTLEVGRVYTVVGYCDWSVTGDIWVDCGEINIPEVILRRPTKLDKALK